MTDGISTTTFVSGIIIAILASSLISVGAITQTGLIQGPKGDKGATGATGLQGLQGDSGIANIPFALTYGDQSDSTNSTEYTDIKGMSLSVTTETSCNLLIIFSAHLILQSSLYSSSGYLRALVDNGVGVSSESFAMDVNGGETAIDRQTFVFRVLASAGTHIVKIQWKVVHSSLRLSLSFVDPESTLMVIALPFW